MNASDTNFEVELPDCTAMERTITPVQKLFAFCFHGLIEGVVAVLAQGGRVTWRSPEGLTPLLAAAQEGHTDICALLLAHGSNVNETTPLQNLTALHYAVAKGHNTLVEALLSWGAETSPQNHLGQTPLYVASQEGHLRCVLSLLKAGASLTLPDNQGMLPIHVAARWNKVEIIGTFLEHGCSPNMVSLTKS